VSRGSVVEDRLSDVLSEFARTLVTDFPIQGILDHLVRRIVDVLPISAAGVTLISPTTEPRFIAASDESAMQAERLQTELGEGPCLAAYHTGSAVSVADLHEDGRFPAFSAQALAQGLVAVFTFPLRDGDRRLGALDLYHTSAGALDDAAMEAAQTLADVTTAYLVNAQTRADLRAASEVARQASLHDGLTGLPNRGLLLERLEQAVARSTRSQRRVGVLYVDIDHFKHVNDTFGHHVGDTLLRAVTRRIVALVRPGDTLARLSGDEFVILCEELEADTQAELVASRIVAAFAESFRLSGANVPVTVSVGIALLSTEAENSTDLVVSQPSPGVRGSAHRRVAERLMREADLAMYQVKKNGGNNYGLVDPSQLTLMAQQVGLSHALRLALAAGELCAEYQPIVSTNGGVVAAEALLRWPHPSRGFVPPATFIPLAEQSGLIDRLGGYVLSRACRDRAGWPHVDGRELSVAINVSPLQLMTADFVDTVESVLAETGTRPDLLTLEMTEGALVEDRERALVVLGRLKRLGVSLALDDFGTGSSSLSHLRDFPVDIIKIDRGFVGDLGAGSASRHIVEAVVTLAHRLGLRVVAEGVETDEQHESLLALGCDYYQGYRFAPALSTEAFSDLVDGSRPVSPRSRAPRRPSRAPGP
jgi:diguanylate cyclase (GGDEF)-like protein